MLSVFDFILEIFIKKKQAHQRMRLLEYGMFDSL